MENSFNQDIMARYLTGNCSHDDLSQLLAWIKAAPENVERFESMVGLYEKVAGLQVSDAQKQAALRRLTRRIEGENATLHRLNPRRWIGYAALFLFMIGLGATLLFNHRTSHKQLITAQATTAIRKITLNDGTQVWLNKGAKLTYPPSFDGKERMVSLVGEAYFNVKHSHDVPFIVESRNARVKVLGTEFNYNTTSEHATAVSLVRGSVEVRSNKSNDQMVLQPGQQANIDNTTGRLRVKEVNKEIAGIWHSDIITFHNANIREIADIISEIYHVDIAVSPRLSLHHTYSGAIHKSAAIDSIFSQLSLTIPISYTHGKDKIILK